MSTDSLKILREYLGAPAWMRYLRIGLAVAAAVALIAGVSVFVSGTDPASAVQFYPAEEDMKGRYAYIDVIGVSDAVASRDSDIWYAVIDGDGYGNIVQLSDQQFAALETHNDWWYSDNEYKIEATRIYGIPDRIPEELAEVIADVFGYENTDRVTDVFGKFFLDTTASPGTGKGVFLLILAVVLLIACGVICAVSIPRDSHARRCISRLDQLGLTDAAASDLVSAPLETVGEDAARISESFIFSRPNGTVLAISDILWLYGHIRRYNGTVVSQTLNAGSRAMDPVPVCSAEKGHGTSSNEEFSRIMDLLQQKNPDIMLGYSAENQKAFSDMLNKENSH